MKMGRYNKASVTVVAGAFVALVTNFWPTLLTADAQTALQTLISVLLVYFVNNK